jgi:methyltransferase (TIGR00027 family)
VSDADHTKGIGATAHWTASARGQESARADRLFNDPWATALAGDVGAAWLAQRPPGGALPMIIRTRFFDDFLQRVAQDDGLRQIVLLAAGLDTRSFRLSWPAGTCLYELDQPALLDYKAHVLQAAGAQPTCARRGLGVDLTGDWGAALLAAGFDPQRPAAWLVEGLLFYLPAEQITALLAAIGRLAAPGSWLGCDVINSAVLTFPYTKAWVDMQAQAGAPWIGTLDDPQATLAALGWQATLSQAGAPEANYGRWTLPVLPTGAPGMPHNWYVTAHKGV